MSFQPNFRVLDLTFNGLIAASMGEDITSDIIFSPCHSLAVQGVYTGSPIGVLKIEYSLDKVNWSELAGSSEGVTTADNTIWDISHLSVLYARLIYTRTSGEGVLNAKAYGKGL